MSGHRPTAWPTHLMETLHQRPELEGVGISGFVAQAVTA